jgi:hypothetical protein
MRYVLLLLLALALPVIAQVPVSLAVTYDNPNDFPVTVRIHETPDITAPIGSWLVLTQFDQSVITTNVTRVTTITTNTKKFFAVSYSNEVALVFTASAEVRIPRAGSIIKITR